MLLRPVESVLCPPILFR